MSDLIWRRAKEYLFGHGGEALAVDVCRALGLPWRTMEPMLKRWEKEGKVVLEYVSGAGEPVIVVRLRLPNQKF